MAGVGDRALPLELIGSVQFGQEQFVQSFPDARLLPDPQPAPGRHPADEAELLRQVLPADPGVQHKQDPLQHTPVIERLPTRITKPPRCPYPAGGISSGHVIALWNWHRHGYLLSLHFVAAPNGASYSLAARIAATLTIARSCMPTPS
jgi:hypothetical protein